MFPDEFRIIHGNLFLTNGKGPFKIYLIYVKGDLTNHNNSMNDHRLELTSLLIASCNYRLFIIYFNKIKSDYTKVDGRGSL